VSHGNRRTLESKHPLEHFRLGTGENLVLKVVDLLIDFLDHRPIVRDKVVDDFI
jgi:hypothetical protein